MCGLSMASKSCAEALVALARSGYRGERATRDRTEMTPIRRNTTDRNFKAFRSVEIRLIRSIRVLLRKPAPWLNADRGSCRRFRDITFATLDLTRLSFSTVTRTTSRAVGAAL